jgi:hypothetical protein
MLERERGRKREEERERERRVLEIYSQWIWPRK